MSKLRTEKLTNVQRMQDGGIVCQCPACAQMGEDRTQKNHLKIFKNGAFSCIKYQNDKQHNKLIYKLVFDSGDNEEIIDDYKPTVSQVKFYPESILDKLIKDHSYWLNRNISLDVLEKMQGGIAAKDEKSKLSGRYCFPIRDLNNKIVGFSGRLVANNEFSTKWKHLFKVRNVAYPFNFAEKYIKESRCVVLVESIGDMLALMSHGINNVLVIFGLNIQSKMIGALISADPLKIIISTNNDKNAAGNDASKKIIYKLRHFFDESRLEIHLPQSKDWGEATKEEIEELKQKINA